MDFNILSQAFIFRGLRVSEVEELISAIPYRIKRFRSGTMIAQSGEQVDSLAIVLSGQVKGEMVDEMGRVIKIEDIPAPGALAAAFIFGNRNRFPVNVVAVTDGELMTIEKNVLLKVLMKNDIILVNFLNMISSRSQFLSEKIKFLNFKTIKGKLAHFILQRSGKERSSIVLDMTQNDLAGFFGVARPSVSRAIREMVEEGLIEARGKNIKIINREGLSGLTVD